MSAPDWLDIGGVPCEVALANPKFQALVEAFEKLEPEQQTFVQALPAAHYVAAQAMRTLQAKGMQLSERTVYRWMSDPVVKRAVDAHRELAGDFAGIDALSVMLRVSAWADYCFEEVDLFSRDGEPLGRGKRDAVNGLKALELLGKHTKAFGAESSTTNITNHGPALFTYQIISSKEGAAPKKIEGSGVVVDAEVTEIPKMSSQILDFTGSPIAEEFYLDDSPDAGIVGPVNSGKTHSLFARSFRHVREQPPGRDGVSRCRIAVVRHSYRALKDTCIPSYQECFNPEFFGPVMPTNMTHKCRFRLQGYPHEFELETLFRAMEDEKDIRGLLSLNLTLIRQKFCAEVRAHY